MSEFSTMLMQMTIKRDGLMVYWQLVGNKFLPGASGAINLQEYLKLSDEEAQELAAKLDSQEHSHDPC